MKKSVVALAVVLLVSLIYSAPSYSDDKLDAVKIGVVDIQRVIIESKGGKEAKAQFETEMTGMKKALTDKEDILKKLRSEITKAGISDAEKKEKEAKFQKEAMEMKRLKDQAESGLRDMDKTITVKMIGEIREVISKIGTEEKYTIILEKDPSVLYMPNAIDMTGRIIENYDKQKAKK
ncbi:MAG: OmpH family outer membrane protein [Nitrospirae bacterium]|nr:OmpH family outer membrane protein [Nitrospirota bacterium]